MKRVIAALVLMTAVVVGCVISLYTSGREFAYLIDLTETAESCYRNGDLDGALAAAETLAAEYPERTKHFALFLPYQSLTDLEKSTASLPLILQHGEPLDFTVEARRCRLMLERLWDQEKPLWENIL